MTDVSMRILLSAVGAGGASSAISSVASSLGGGGLAGTLIKVGAIAVTTAIAIGTTAVKAASDFQSSLTTLATGAGESTKNIAMVGNGILNLAVQTGTSTQQLTSGMYQIESAGYHGAAGLAVLKAAAEGAKVGNADLGTVADATTTIMTDYGIKSNNASQAVNTLIATVANGKTTMQQLAGSLSQILPTASAAGVSLTDTSAAMATMTGEGVPAAQAATYLRQTILGLEAPTKGTVTALQGVGLTSKQVSDEMKVSLPGALKMITDAVGKKFPAGSADYVNAIKNISGGSKTMQGMLDLTGSHMATFNANVANISSAVKNGGNNITGWSQIQQNFNQKMSQAGQVVGTFMIRLGQGLLPVLTNIVSAMIPLLVAFSNWIFTGQAGSQIAGIFHSVMATIMPVLQIIGSFLVSTFTPVWKQLVQVYQSQLVPAFNQFLSAMKPILPQLQTFGKVILGVVVVALVLLVGIIAGVVTGLANMLPGVVRVFTGIVQIISGAVQVISGIIAFLVDLFTGQFGKLGSDLGVIWGGIVTMLQGVWSVIAGIFSAAVGLVGGIVVGFISTIVNIFTGLYNDLVGHSIIPDMINGIVMWFEQLPGRAGAAIQGFISTAMGMFNGFVSSCSNIGANIVNGIANGITSTIGNITSAISSVTSAIASFLPHSPAERGELSHLNEYGPALVTGISTGIIQSLPIMLNAMDMLTTPVGSAMAAISDPRTVADQLNFTKAPTSISSGTKKPVETAAQKKKEEEEKKAEAKKKEEEKKAAAAEKAHEKKVVHADIKEIKAELHIHTSNAKLDKAQIDEIIEQAMRQFGLKLGDEIRAQFGNV